MPIPMPAPTVAAPAVAPVPRARRLRAWLVAAAGAAGLGLAPAAWAVIDVNKQFNPINIAPGQTSTLTLALVNSAQVIATGVAFTDTLPDAGGGQVVVANPANLTYACTNAGGGAAVTTGTLTATPGASTVSLAGGTLPAGNGTLSGTCTVTLTVTSAVSGTHVNTIPPGGVTSANQGNNPTKGEATLFVGAYAAPTITKTFSNTAGNSVLHGQDTGNFVFVLTNPNAAPLNGATFTDTFPTTASALVAAGAATNTCPGTVTDTGGGTLADGDTGIKLSNGTIPANGSCRIVVPVRAANPNLVVAGNATTAGNDATNTVAAGALTTTQGVSNAASTSVTVNVETGGYVAKGFSPTTITGDGVQTATLFLDLYNRNVQPITGASLTDTFPAQIAVAPTPNVQTVPNGCATVTATAGSGSVTMSAATIPAAGTADNATGKCQAQVAVVVKAGNRGTFTNSIAAGNYGTNLPAYGAAASNLVATSPITGSKVFNPTSVGRNGITKLTVTLNNASTVAANITGFTDDLTTLGTGFVVAPTPNAATTCGGTVTATAGATSITKANGAIPAGASCTVSVDVLAQTAAAIGGHTNTIAASAVATALGSNAATITAPLTVVDGIGGSKSFAATSVPVGTSTTLTITLDNTTATAATGLSLSDLLTSMDTNGNVVVAGTPAPTNTCGGTLTAATGGTSITLAGGTLAANSSCTITVPVVGKKGVPLNTRTNTIAAGAIGSSIGSNTTPISANLAFTAGVTVAKAFAPNSQPQTGNSTLTITLANVSTSPATINSLTDNLGTTMGAGTVTVSGTPTTNCTGSTLNVTAGPVVTLTGGSIAAGSTCTVTLPVSVAGDATIGAHVNSIAINGLDTSLNNNATAANGTLNVIAGLSLAKSFSPAQLAPNQAGITRLSVTVSKVANTVAATGIAFTDNLTTMGAGHTVAATPNATSTCGGTFTATAGATSFALSGGSLPAGATSCTLALDVQTPNTFGVGTTQTNTIGANAVTTDQALTNSTQATASITRTKAPDLQVLNKNFIPQIIDGGAISQLEIDFLNTQANAQTLTGVALTDNFTGTASGIIIANSPSTSFTGTGCALGTINATPGNNFVSLSGATIAAGSTCKLFVNVTSYIDGNLTNTIAAGSVTSDQGATNPNLVTKTLTVNRNVNVQKYFTPSIIESGGTSTLHIRFFNTNNLTRTGCTAVTGSCPRAYLLQDTLPTGVAVAAGTPTNTCGGTLADGTGAALNSGDTAIRVVGGTINADQFCDVTVPVTGTPSGNYLNTIAANQVATNENATNSDPTSDTLTIVAKPTIAKAFAPNAIGVGKTSTVTFTLSNPNSATILASGFTGASFTDTLAGMSIATPGAAGGTCAGAASNSFAAGATSLGFTGLTIPAASSCTVTVSVTSATAGTYPNTASGVSTAQTQTPGAPSGTVTLTVNNAPTLTKAFGTGSLGAGQKTTLVFTLTNPNASVLTLASANPLGGFTDTFPTSPGAMTLADTITATTCGGTPVINNNANGALAAGAPGIRVNGGTIPANASCTITVDVTATAIGTYNNLSSVLNTTTGGSSAAGASASVTVASGQPLSGFVYLDANSNGARDGGEDWTAGTPVFVNLVQGGAVVQSTTVNPGTGAYSFPAVAAGSYTVVLSNSSTGLTGAAPAGYRFTAPTDGSQIATVGSSPALNYNFGLVTGGTVGGRVFKDSGPTANDGIQQSATAEPGLAGVSVRLTNCAGTVYSSASTDGSGNYSLTLPGTLANGSALCVEETNPAGYLSTGADVAGTALPSGTGTAVGGTTYTYTRTGTPDRIAFTYSTATPSYGNLNFGDIPPNDFTTDNQQTVLAGTSVTYAHTYTAQSAGAVVFTTSAVANPNVPGWSETLYADSNCNGQIDAGEPQITGPTSLVAGQKLCIVDREFVPANAPTNAQNVVTLTSTFTYSGATPALANAVLTHTDTTIVGDASGAALKLVKTVSSGSATPGAVLTYTISYSNQSAQPLNTITVRDATPAYTSFVSATASTPLPASLTACSKTTPAGGPAACAATQAAGGRGAMTWTFTGSLQPGAGGSVSFQVQVDP